MTSFLQLALVLAEIVGFVSIADFLAGFVHWLEDAYFSEDTPVIGPMVIRPNIIHHHLPRYMTKLSWWESSRELVALGAITLAGAWMLNALTWQVWFFVALSVNANQVHKWSHQTRAENGPIIARLQDWKILQTPHHHGLHHKDPKNTYYCPITNFVNPLLERISFWNRLENIIERLTGITHREDTAVRGNGPGPAWLDEYRPAPRAVVVATTAAAAAVTPKTVRTATLLPPRRAGVCGRNCANCQTRCARGAAAITTAL